MNNMIIDGVSSSIYSAKLVTYSVGSTSFEVNTVQSASAVIRRLLSSNEGTRSLNITLEVTGVTEHQAALKLSHLTAALQGRHSIRIGDGYLYDAILTAAADPEQELRNRFFITYTFDAVRQGEERVVPFSSSCSVYCDSTAGQTPCKFRILSNRNIPALTLFDMTVYDLKTNDVFVIDGVQKLATVNGSNAFEQLTLVNGTDFPSLIPGWNKIMMSEPADVTLSYFPIYI